MIVFLQLSVYQVDTNLNCSDQAYTDLIWHHTLLEIRLSRRRDNLLAISI
jgi:hypothetical protein